MTDVKTEKHIFGGKTIGSFAGIALLINNITGPGIPQLPNMFVEAGWLFPTLCILGIWIMSTVSSSMYCEAMRKIPGNEHFKDRIEYSTIVKHYFGNRWYIAAMIGLNGALQCLNIISVVQSAQVMDSAISAVFGNTCGINLTPFQNVWTDDDGTAHPLAHSTDFWSCVDLKSIDNGNPWGCHIVFSIGYFVVMAMAVPCGRWNLDDNMPIQTVAFVLTVAFWIIWIVASMAKIQAADSWDAVSIPAINNDPGTGTQAAWLGTILFNFGFVTTVPSWVNEKRPGVSVNRTLWISTTGCILVFFAVGITGAMAYKDSLQGIVTGECATHLTTEAFNCPNDLLQALTNVALMPDSWRQSGFLSFLLNFSVYAFPTAAVVSSIPVFSIVIKYNMIENGFSKATAFSWAVLCPWLIGFPLLYMPDALAQFINFTSLFFVTFTDFVVPLLLYRTLQQQRQEGETQTEAQSVLTDGLVAQGVHHHYAFPKNLGLSIGAKRTCAMALAVILGLSSTIAAVMTIQQGTYVFDQQTCALTGS